jgi:uncharacterized membrane protein
MNRRMIDRRTAPGANRTWWRMGRQIMLAGLVMCMVAAQILPALSSAAFIFTVYQVPGAYQIFDIGQINDLGQIVGDYRQNTGSFRSYGFVQTSGGAVAPIDVIAFASATIRYPLYVSRFATTGINNAGTVVGHYTVLQLPSSVTLGIRSFIRDAAGNITIFDVPGSAGSMASGINDAGQIVGSYFTPDGGLHGFLRGPGGAVNSFDVPAAAYTSATGLNDFGQVVGVYSAPDYRVTHAFLRDPDGTIATIDVPGAVYTSPTGINDLGQIVGQSSTPSVPALSAFLRDPDGTFTQIAAPAPAVRTSVWGINNRGQMVGRAPTRPFDVSYFVAARPVAQLPSIAPPPPTPPGTAPAIRRLKRDFCLHEPETFFGYGTTVGLASAAASVMKRVSPQAKYAIYASQLLALEGLGRDYLSCVQDTFDPNYGVRYEPRVPRLPSISASTDISAPLAASLTEAIRDGSRAVAYLQAANVSLNRYASALEAHDNASASLQEQAVLSFAKLSSDELELFARALRASAEIAQGTPLNQPVSTDAVQAVFDSFRAQGAAALPAIEQGGFRMFGLDPSYLLTGGLSHEHPAPREASERLSRPFSGALENIAHVMDRLARTLREGLAHQD